MDYKGKDIMTSYCEENGYKSFTAVPNSVTSGMFITGYTGLTDGSLL